MAPRLVSDTTFTLQLYRGITYSTTFTYTDPNDVPINLTGKSIVIGLKDIFDNTLLLGSALPASALGSTVTITDAVNGKFRLYITDEETETADLGSGRWWIEEHDGGDVNLLLRDDVQVDDI